MRWHPKKSWLALSVLTVSLSLNGAGRLAVAQDPGPEGQEGVEVLNRGPIHEAFASAVTYDPTPCPVVIKQPPDPIEEQPPEDQPTGQNFQWVTGYWFWEESRTDFIWISGIWREPPPDCQWTPGYWGQCEGGWRWTCGCWTPVDQQQGQYLPTPPLSVESGPNCPCPGETSNYTWTPGYWKWCLECEVGKYVWCPGSWVAHQTDWIWTPPRYVPTPCGCLFVKGYWDYPLERRGIIYAPVYYTQPCYTRPNYTYCPTVCIPTTTLTTCLFVRPANYCYCFGDYYDRSCMTTGIYPWYAYHNSRYGCEPIYSYCSNEHRGDSQWQYRIREDYCYRRDNAQARPPWLYREQRDYLSRAPGKFNHIALGDTVRNLSGRNGFSQGLVKLTSERRLAMAEQGRQTHLMSRQRLTQETGAGRNREQPHHLNLPWSPIASRTQRSNLGNGLYAGNHGVGGTHQGGSTAPNQNHGAAGNTGVIGPQQGGSLPPHQNHGVTGNNHGIAGNTGVIGPQLGGSMPHQNHGVAGNNHGVAGNTGVIGPQQGGSLPPHQNHGVTGNNHGVGGNPGVVGPHQGGNLPSNHFGGPAGHSNYTGSPHPSAAMSRHQPPAHPVDPQLDHGMRHPGSGYVPNRALPDHNARPIEHHGTGHPGGNSFGQMQGSRPSMGSMPSGSSHGPSGPSHGSAIHGVRR